MPKLVNGEPVPDFALNDTDGNEWRLSDHLGKMVIIHTCRGEF
jgi:peroxiredoxin